MTAFSSRSSTLYKRKKQPEAVRRNLLDCAARIAVDRGLASVTIQAVSDAAGVTKGGLLHHFPNKQALIEAVFADLLERFGADIDELIANDAVDYGVFTRAYVNATLRASAAADGRLWAALFISMVTDPGLRDRWNQWLGARLEKHKATDSAPHLQIIRYAVDGVWLADLMQADAGDDRERLRARLCQMTKRKDCP